MVYRIECLDRSAPISGERDDNHPYPAVRAFVREHKSALPGDGPWQFRVVDADGGETTWLAAWRSVPMLVCEEVPAC